MSLENSPYFYSQDSDEFTPQTAAGSPWSATMQHGGPVNAIVTMPIETIARELELQVARLTIDILKPVPMKTVTVTTQVIRRGAKMAVVDAFLMVAGNEEPVASARAVLLKFDQDGATEFDSSQPIPHLWKDLEPEPWIPEEMASHLPDGLHNLIRFRPFEDTKRPIYWLNADCGMLQSRAMTPVEQCATIADMTTAVASRMCIVQQEIANPNVMGVMNTNTTLHLSRPPAGEWFGFTDYFIQVVNGYGMAECVLNDERGCLGKVTQNVIVV